MLEIKKWWGKLKNINTYSKIACKLGFWMMVCFYIVSITSYLVAPYANYLKAMALHRGSLEAAPASLAVGICAGLLCDLVLASKEGGNG